MEPPAKKPFGCKICNKSFRVANHLVKHIESHKIKINYDKFVQDLETSKAEDTESDQKANEVGKDEKVKINYNISDFQRQNSNSTAKRKQMTL